MLRSKDFVRTLHWADGSAAQYVSLPELARSFPAVARYPTPLKVMLEAAVRRYDGHKIGDDHVMRLMNWHRGVRGEIPFFVARVLLQDVSGIPLLGDLAALRSEAQRRGSSARDIEPEVPVDLVIDHSVIVDRWGDSAALQANMAQEFRQNLERYEFLKWAQQAFRRLCVVPPGTGIVHQVNLERLATGIAERDGWVFPDTLVGTDSHTTMANGIGVLGWGVGGIEAAAALMGEPLYFDSPEVVGVALRGALRPGITATDLALHLTRLLREHGVVGKLLEFHGSGARTLAVMDRATVANMAPEYGATAAWFGIDDSTFDYYKLTGRSEDVVARMRKYYKMQGMLGIPDTGAHDYSEVITLDLAAVERCLSGPARPEQLIALGAVPASLGLSDVQTGARDDIAELSDGDIVLAAITSCTNTANPTAMIAAGLLAKAAVERGMRVAPHVKTVLAPGSRAVTVYLRNAGLLDALEQLGFHVSAYGCAACVGNTGGLAPGVERAIAERELTVAAVLSGNRNFEGRIHKAVKANYLAAPALVVAYALAGSVRGDLGTAPCGYDRSRQPVYLNDIWPESGEITALVNAVVTAEAFSGTYTVADNEVSPCEVECGHTFAWNEKSTYFVEPPFFRPKLSAHRAASIANVPVLAVLGDSVTTDHISPVGAIAADSDAGLYLAELGIALGDFNTFGARRSNHHVMVRGTFGSPRLKNALVAPQSGPLTRSRRDGRICSIHTAAMENVADGTMSIVLAGHYYGSGSARDWAAKGTALLGVRAVVAKSFERIHRSNLVLMGVLPIEVRESTVVTWDAVHWTGREQISIEFDESKLTRADAVIHIQRDGESLLAVAGRVRIDTEAECRYFAAGGMLPYLTSVKLGGASE
ncbi:MAG: aconitate hydratase AcnA [Burkholderiaceae bacterium]|jgi:aconitate hydratase|nr:aconitate hydratase AcnA [Burkholderiaceae bacterium]